MRDLLRRIFLLMLVVGAAVLVRTYWGQGRSFLAAPWHVQIERRLDVVERARWKARAPMAAAGSLGFPERVTVHHAGGAVYRRTQADDVAVTLRAIQKEHQDGRGWADLGYHYVVDPAGRIWEGRSATTEGAHAGPGGLNRRNVGVLLLGNFDLQRPPPEQVQALERFLDALAEICQLPASRVQGHDEVRRGGGFAGTRCPGRHLEAHLETWRASRERAAGEMRAARAMRAAGAGS